MKSDLVGVWSADALFAPGSQEDEILVFRSDGTGWIEWMNFASHTIEFFEWAPTSPGWVDLVSLQRLERDLYNLKHYLQVGPTFDVEHHPFTIQQVETPIHGSLPQLELQLPGWNAGLYGLIEADADSRSHSQAPT